MENKEYAELPEPDVRRLAIESGLIRKADSLRPTTWGRILRFAQAIQALRASHGQAPAGAAPKADQQLVDRHLSLLFAVWDAEKIMEAAGCKKADFATMFAEFATADALQRSVTAWKAAALAQKEGK